MLGMELSGSQTRKTFIFSGSDNIALHEVSRNFATGAVEQQLDHLGFVVATIDRVKTTGRNFRASGVKSSTPSRCTATAAPLSTVPIRTGSFIQMLYEPNLSPQEID